MIPFVKKIPAIEHFKALVLMFKPVKTPQATLATEEDK